MLVNVKNISADGYKLQIEDSMPQAPVNLVAERINFKGTNLSTAKKSKCRAALSFTLNRKGYVRTNGYVGIDRFQQT